MQDQMLQLLKDHIDAKVDPIKDDISDLKADVRDLKEFRWKITGFAIAVSAVTGSGSFVLSKVLDKLF